MPQIAQQDYIFIPILDDDAFLPNSIPQDIQNRLVQLAKDGRIMDVIFTCAEGRNPMYAYERPLFVFQPTDGAVDIYLWSREYSEITCISCEYQEITNEPDAQEENHNDAQ